MELTHYGILRRSGRYPYGSGKDPYQHSATFLSRVDELKKQGVSEKDIASYFGMSTTELRSQKSLARNMKRQQDVLTAQTLKEKGYSNVAIATRMGINESSVRGLLKPSEERKKRATENTIEALRFHIDSKTYLDVGLGSEIHMGVSRGKFDSAITALKNEGYTMHYVKVTRPGTSETTFLKVLAPPGTPYSEVFNNRDKIRSVPAWSTDGGETFEHIKPIKNISSSRVKIKYGDEGGSAMDGVIELRQGVPDLSLGNSRYAQVRIGVDGSHYLKGMAIYSDSIPDGYDIVYNTNKKKGTPKEDVFKPQADDENPFGAIVRQSYYVDRDGKKQLSALNIVGYKEGSGEEGSWESWSKSLSSQFLSKQEPSLAKEQLKLAYDKKKEQYDRIMSLTNPAVKQKLLTEFGDECDSDAVHLKGAALPRQRTQVLLPLPKLKENEVYAPNFKDGETIVLVRHPHAGPFEIPELRVNNKDATGKKFIGNAKDAIGINPKTAAQLSGADFDGDSVLAIPNNDGKIKTASPLKGLANFDPKDRYPGYEGMKPMTKRQKGIEMGSVSNLITDMQIKGASEDELAAAVRHSMVVIDAYKHKLDYRSSAIDNGIANLKTKFQGGPNAGASTLISKASSERRVPVRDKGVVVVDPKTGKKKKMYIDPDTGKKLYTEKEETVTYVDARGKTVTRTRTVSSTAMAETDDAHTLSSGSTMEGIYADHANRLKALANQARKESLAAGKIKTERSAKEAFADEVASLNQKLSLAVSNKPLERQAMLLADSTVRDAMRANPDMDKDDIKKLRTRAIIEARARIGAKKQTIEITPKEWDAIQAGAISNSKLTQILDNADMDVVKSYAMPKETKSVHPSDVARAKRMLSNGYTRAEVAEAIGVSVTTIMDQIE